MDSDGFSVRSKAQHSRRRALTILGAAALAPAVATAQTKTALKVCTTIGDSFSQPFYGVDTGMFANAGLDVDLIVENNAGAAVAAVAGGSADVGLGDFVGLANAVGHGIPMVLLAGAARYLPTAAPTLMCVAKNSPIQRPKDLEGTTVAVVTLVGFGTVATKAWLAQNGVDLAKVKLIELTFASMAPALTRGTIAAAVIGEPLLSQARDEVRSIGRPYDAISKDFLLNAWFTTREWLGKNTDTARRLVRVVYDTARWANTHQEQSLPILAKYLKLDPERLRGMVRSQFATSLDAAAIQPVIEAGLKYQVIQQPLDVNSIIAKL
jgi:NitT/TauT family transport system substrate-binding protein